jgi:hypothetical protein
MRAIPQSPANQYTALVLKVVGIILILGVMIDYIVLSVPPNFLNSEWLVNLINEWIGRGTVPLIGVALIIFGVWIDRTTSEDLSRQSPRRGLLMGTLIFSLILGVLFLGLAPLYFNSSRLASATATRNINEQATAAQQQLDALLAQQKTKVSALLANEQQVALLQQELNNSQLPAEQQAQLQQLKETLQKVKSNPALLDQEVTKARAQGLEQIKQRQQQALDQMQRQIRNARNQAIVSSLLLSAGYFIVGGTGLKLTQSGSRRSSKTKTRKKR